MFPIEDFRATLSKAVAIFREHEIPFHLTGGITSIFYGEPRMTQDIDIVVSNQQIAGMMEPFLKSLADSDFMFDSNAVRRAVADRELFQLLDRVKSLKLDIYPRELIPGELERSTLVEVFEGTHLPITSRADSAASKLVWISKGSHKSRRDLRKIFRAGSDADRDVIEKLANSLDLAELLREVLEENDEIE